MGGHHREEPGGGDRGAQVGGHRLELDVLAVEVPLQQLLVLGLVDDRLHQRTAPLLDQRCLLRVRRANGGRAVAVVGHRAAEQVDQPGQAAAGEQRDVGRLGVAERPLAAGHRLVEVGPGLLELGHRDRAGHPDHRALPPQQPGGLVDLVAGRHHEQRGVGGPQPGPDLADEVRMARGVQQVDVDRAAGHRRGPQRGGGGRLAAGMPARRTRGDQSLEQRGLARRGGARPGRRCGSAAGLSGPPDPFPLASLPMPQPSRRTGPETTPWAPVPRAGQTLTDSGTSADRLRATARGHGPSRRCRRRRAPPRRPR